MKKILVLTNSFMPKPNAIGVCLETILHEFSNRGYEAYILKCSEGKGYEKIGTNHIYNIPPYESKRLKIRLFQKLRTLYRVLRYYPLENKGFMKEYKKLANKLIEENDFEFVLCTQKPTFTNVIGREIKGEHSEIRLILYELDSITDNVFNNTGWSKYFSRRNKIIERKNYNSADLILRMINHANFYSKKRYMKYDFKSRYVDIPLLDNRFLQQKKTENREEKDITCVYTGALNKYYRTPQYFLDLLRNCSHEIGVRVLFYSGYDAESVEQVKKAQEEMPNRVFLNNTIEKELLDKEMLKMDICLCIGNNFSEDVGAVPSKLFYYMSFAKPIIHIAPKKNDVCIKYLERYPYALILYTSENMGENVKKFEEFVRNVKQKSFDYVDLNKLYPMNTPAYTVDIIVDFFKMEM
ncbi:MAG: hypothetical protein NC180_03605 [Muribaculaceae bacterium]|nr:hypothetical protein [Roseburia sp.]MCM1431222.1 hypothetical protein [Muribaculaceae bacterium]MCM1492292.1 hypothetical protein [Muribaculaceae bacterium]